MAKWKVTRESEDSYKGDKGEEKLEALKTVKLFNDMTPATAMRVSRMG